MPHKLGQVFLKDANMRDKIVRFADLKPDDHCIEIGCGEGVLSEPLAQQSKHLTIIEIDETWLTPTKERLKNYDNVTYILGDILDVGLPKGQPNARVIANIPYYISAKILKLLIQQQERFHDAILMVQKEFAQKCCAKPGSSDYTSLTLYLSYYFKIKEEFKVPKTCFKPIPKVDSAIISIVPHTSPPVSVDEPEVLFDIIRSSFWGRRKKLLTCLRSTPYLEIDSKCKEIPFFKDNPNRRGETLTLEEFAQLYRELKPYIISRNKK